MTAYIKYGLIVVAIGLVYIVGYKHAETKGELLLEEVKMAHAQEIINAQEKEKANYEERIENLVADLNALRTQHDDGLRQLQSFRERTTDLDTCRRQRSDLAVLANEGEQLLREASIYLTGGKR